MTFHLRAWRQAAAYKSQQALADAAGVPQSTISHLETGAVAAPRMATAHQLVRGLNRRLPQPIGLDDLFTPPPEPPHEAAHG